MPTKCMYAILIDSCKEEKKWAAKIYHLIKIQRRCWWGGTFYANADISPFCLASVMVQNYLLLLSDADSQNWKNCKTNKSKFWDLYPHSKITLIIWFWSFCVHWCLKSAKFSIIVLSNLHSRVLKIASQYMYNLHRKLTKILTYLCFLMFDFGIFKTLGHLCFKLTGFRKYSKEASWC